MRYANTESFARARPSVEARECVLTERADAISGARWC
jgi:hypothetical protein